MNQSNCFKSYQCYSPFGTIYDDIYGASTVNKIDPKEFPFSVEGKNFKTRAEAEQHAKRRSGEISDDVVISQRVAIVKFPIPDLKVEELVVS